MSVPRRIPTPRPTIRSTPFWNVVCGWDDMTMCVVHTARLVGRRCHHSETMSAIAAAAATRRAWTVRLLDRRAFIMLQGRFVCGIGVLRRGPDHPAAPTRTVTG